MLISHDVRFAKSCRRQHLFSPRGTPFPLLPPTARPVHLPYFHFHVQPCVPNHNPHHPFKSKPSPSSTSNQPPPPTPGNQNMHLPSLPSFLPLLLLLGTSATADPEKVTTEYTLTKECTRKTRRGDTISVHYRGTLASDGTQFDASYDRGTPLDFEVGRGMVIKG